MAVVLVTGANRGLGLEFTRQLLARGDQVFASCRHPARASALQELAAAHPQQLGILTLDVADPRSVVNLAQELVRRDLQLDLLLNNAGVLVSGERFGQLTAQSLRGSFATNVQGPLLLTQACAGRLAAAAKVVNLSSRIGSIAGTHSFSTPSYAISKAALNMLTRQLGHALAERGIAVLAISPGWVRTDMGGAEATLEVAESVARVLAVIDALQFDPDAIGRFVGEDGHTIDW